MRESQKTKIQYKGGYLRQQGSGAVVEMATLNSFYKYQCYAYIDNANVQMFSMSASDVTTDRS